MAFIRRVRTASGATAVQLVEYTQGRQRILKDVGSAHTDAELGLLMERARELLDDPGQEEFDLGIVPVVPRKELLGPPGDPVLFPEGAVVRELAVSTARVMSESPRV